VHRVVLVEAIDQTAHFLEVVFVRIHVENQLIRFGQTEGVKLVYVGLRAFLAEDLVFILEQEATFGIFDNHGFINDL
jgi:hypothetical protein